MNGAIQNFNQLATTSGRKFTLEIIEAGIDAINTEKVINNEITLEGDILNVQGDKYDLTKYKNIRVIGFGKSACDGARALEKILKDKLNGGVVIGLSDYDSKYLKIFKGTHPIPSISNVEAGKEIYAMANQSSEDDLLLVIVSGGGSALLCYPRSECDQGVKLYNSFLDSGKTIREMNTIRKHMSVLKGGGLAKIAYPATIIGLVFSDVPGDSYEDVASGPTYKDNTTVADAEKIIKENRLGSFRLIETPKEDKYFEKVKNYLLVSNKIAVDKMAEKAREMNLNVNVVSTDLYDDMETIIKKMFDLSIGKGVTLAAGEPSLVVSGKTGKGGRNMHMSLLALSKGLLKEENVFVSFASDGMDNSDMAGAIADLETIKKAKAKGEKLENYLRDFNSYNFFARTGDLIKTGPTGANVSDLFILFNNKNA